MTQVDAEALRRAVVGALSETEPRAAEAMRRAAEVWTSDTTTWESSAGPVTGHLVGIAVDAATLGDIHAHPHLADALVEAVAAEVARTPGASLTELRLHWSGVELDDDEGYRGAVATTGAERDLGAAIVRYLRANGEAEAAAHVRSAEVVAEAPFHVRVRVVSGAPAKSAALRTIGRAVEVLLAGPEKRRVVVEHG